MLRLLPVFVLLVGLLGVVTGGRALAEEVAPDEWPQVTEVPSWVLAVPAREGWVRIAQTGRSNLRELIFAPQGHERLARQTLATRLRPVLGAGAEAVAEKVPVAPMVETASWFSPAPPGKERTVGGSYWVKFALFEYPLAAILDATPEGEREAVRATLAESPHTPTDVLPWKAVEEPPAWADQVTIEGDVLRVASREKSSQRDVAEAFSLVSPLAYYPIQKRLKAVFESNPAYQAAVGGAAKARLVARAVHTQTTKRLLRRAIHEFTLWQLWEIPLSAILEGIPAEKHAEARAALAR